MPHMTAMTYNRDEISYDMFATIESPEEDGWCKAWAEVEVRRSGSSSCVVVVTWQHRRGGSSMISRASVTRRVTNRASCEAVFHVCAGAATWKRWRCRLGCPKQLQPQHRPSRRQSKKRKNKKVTIKAAVTLPSRRSSRQPYPRDTAGRMTSRRWCRRVAVLRSVVRRRWIDDVGKYWRCSTLPKVSEWFDKCSLYVTSSNKNWPALHSASNELIFTLKRCCSLPPRK